MFTNNHAKWTLADKSKGQRMCWSESASVAMVGLGTAATVVTAMRGEPRAIPVALGFFTVMEARQAGGYGYIDECHLTPNRNITVLSYLHIALQPLFINAFAMATAPAAVSKPMKHWAYALAALATMLMLLRLVPFNWTSQCPLADPLCGPAFCTVSGTWHLAWEMPLNDMWRSLGMPFADAVPFPSYILAVFFLPLLYGAWRFVVFHAIAGPILASLLTNDPNEMPAIWCLFSIGIVLVSLNPQIRGKLLGSVRRGVA